MTVVTANFMSKGLQRPSAYTAILPEPGRVGKGPYPVLVQLHGYWDDYRSWLEKSNLRVHVERYPLIVVLPNGENSFYANYYPPLLYETMIVEDLREHVLATLPASDGPWVIGGLSMGGFGAVYLGLKHPQLFRSIFAHSSVFWDSEGPDKEAGPWARQEFAPALRNRLRSDMSVYRLAKKLPKRDRPRLGFDCGTEDFLIEHNRRFHAYLDTIGYNHTYAEHPGAHTWDYWDLHVRTALRQHAEVLGIEEVQPPA